MRIKKYIFVIFAFMFSVIMLMANNTNKKEPIYITHMSSHYNRDVENNKSKVCTIKDIINWNSKVKKLLDSYYIEIHKVELLRNKTYTIFYLGYTNGLLADCAYSDLRNIAQANAFHNYKIVGEDEKISVEVFCDRSKKRLLKAIIYTQKRQGNKSTVRKELVKYKINKTNNKVLSDEDFKVNYHKTKIGKKTNLNKIIKNIGTGSANASNNFGYIGRSVDRHQRRRYGYPANNPVFNIIVLDNSVIERIDEYSTIKGLHLGDSYSKVVNLYGKPNFEIQSGKIRPSQSIYTYKDKQLVVNVFNGKVINLSMQFMDLYEF